MKFILLSVISMCAIIARGQNLILNSSFEKINYCEANIPCSPSGWYSVSNIPYGYQNNLAKSYDGKHCIAFLIAYKQEIRSYWQTLLLCKLQSGSKYLIKFYLYSPNMTLAPNYFGVYLSDTLYHTTNDTLIQLNESISIGSEDIHLLKNGWNEINLSFIATGKEKCLLLGNFDKNTNKVILENVGGSLKYIEYYIDQVSLKSVNAHENECNGYKIRADSIYASNTRHKFDQGTEVSHGDTIKGSSTLTNAVVDSLVLGKINFNFNSDKLINSKLIEDYFNKISISTILKIQVIGYTDSIGSKSYNIRLSERRASSVKDFLLNTFRFSNDIIVAMGKGITTDKLVLNDNRRVELIIFTKK